jgi:N6-adenosine-specific RNA methylase IME4
MSELYRVVVADPPWAFSDKLKMSDVKRGAEANYRTLTVDDVCALPVKDWVLEDSLLALWVPSSLLSDGMRVMASWGFAQKQIYTWVKQAKSGGIAFGMGRQFRGATEHALIGTRGRPKPTSRSERNVELSLGLPHSKKPEELQNRLQKMYPDGPYLELFARRARDGWTCVGNQAPGYDGLDIRDWYPGYPQKSAAAPAEEVLAASV